MCKKYILILSTTSISTYVRSKRLKQDYFGEIKKKKKDVFKITSIQRQQKQLTTTTLNNL